MVLTGLDDEEMEQAARRRGAMAYLVKGRVTPQTLVHVMQDAVAKRNTARQQTRDVFGNRPGAQAS